MDRRSFLQFMGVSSASLVASTTLAKLPEAESQILLLDKPKDIVLANTMPSGIDFVITNVVSLVYDRNENIQENYALNGGHFLTPGTIGVEIELEAYSEFPNFNFYEKRIDPATFTFDLHYDNFPQYKHHEALNGRKFMAKSYRVNAVQGNFTMCDISAIEVLR